MAIKKKLSGKSRKPRKAAANKRAPSGRPPKYAAAFATRARALCGNGATDYDLAREFDVAPSTIWRWSTQHPEFCRALQVGKGEFDAQIERSLAMRAKGFAYPVTKVGWYYGKPVYAQHTEYALPDVGAARLWLANRQPERWRDVNRVEVDGRVKADVQTNSSIDLSGLSAEALLALAQALGGIAEPDPYSDLAAGWRQPGGLPMRRTGQPGKER